MRKKILLILFIAAISQPIKGSNLLSLPEKEQLSIRHGINLLYNLHFKKALTQFQSLLPRYKNHPAPWFFSGMVYWLKMINMDNSPQTAAKFLQHINLAIRYAEKKQTTNKISSYFFKAGALGFLGRYYLNKKNWLKAAQAGWKAYKILRKIKEKEHKRPDINLGLGFFNFYAGKLPHSLKNIAALLGIRGDWRKGLRQLHFAANKGAFTKIEAQIILAHLYTYKLYQGRRAVYILRRLCALFPRNTRLKMTLSDALLISGKSRNAITLAKNTLKKISTKKISRNWLFLVHSRLGKFYLSTRQYKQSLEHLLKAIDSKPYKPEGYLPWVYLRLGKICLYLNDKTTARKALLKTIRLGFNGKAAAIAKRILKRL